MFNSDDFKIKRSPCKMSWHIIFNGRFITAVGTKREAKATVEDMRKVIGV